MLIDGEKYACEACVRGHRVSNCQHSDRPLQHINKKGRPVSQCQHCRSMRKSRSHHVKCDCGEKTHKCIHLQTTVDGHKESCCCNHGGRCTCSHKQEHSQLDTVPESDSENEDECLTAQSGSSNGSSKNRKRANTTHSDGMLSFDENGHHKPTYKHKKASQKNGPYQLNRVNSMHSAGSIGNRSVDNLLHGSNSSDSRNGSVSNSALQGRRKSKSEAASPLMTGTSSLSQLNGQLPPLDLSAIDYPPYVPNSADFFGNISDHEQPMFSAGLSAASVDWSHYEGLEFASRAAEFAPSSYSQPQSFGGFDFSGSEQMPTLTTNTSTPGEGSDVEDFLSNGLDEYDLHAAFRNGAAATAAAAAYGRTNSQAALSLSNADLPNLDYDDFKFVKSETNSNEPLRDPASLAGDDAILSNNGVAGITGFSTIEDDPAFWMENYQTLPNSTAEGLSEPPDSTMTAMWEVQ